MLPEIVALNTSPALSVPWWKVVYDFPPWD